MKSPIEENSPEWNTVHFRLQLLLGTPAAVPLKIFRFPNLDQRVEQLKERYHGKTILDVHLDLSGMDESVVNRIAQKKYKMSDLTLEAGHLKVEVDPKESKRLWLLKAAVGDSYEIHSETRKDSKISVPQQFDSIYLASEMNQQFYKHDYILKDHDQYVIEYQVMYTLDKTREYNPKQVRCDKCKRSSAEVYCKNQEVFFCRYCDTQHHKDSFLASHAKEDISKFNTVGFCKQSGHHKKLELYCETCEKAMCIQCTIAGWHSSKQYGHHQTKALRKYYQEKRMDNENESAQKKHQLQKSLESIEESIKEVEVYSTEIENKITRIYETALRKHKNQVKDKLDQLLIFKIQTKRQYDQLIWTDSFIKFQQDLLKPIAYLQAQKQYEQFKIDLLNAPLRRLPKINPDNIIVQGEIQLIKIHQFYEKEAADTFVPLPKHSKQKPVGTNEKKKSSAVKPQDKQPQDRQPQKQEPPLVVDPQPKPPSKLKIPIAPSVLQSCMSQVNFNFIKVIDDEING